MGINLLRVIWLFLVIISSCNGEKNPQVEKFSAPGYWFQIILIVIPLFIFLIKGLMDLGEIKDSLVSIGSQTRRILSRLEDLEDRVKMMEKAEKLETEKEK